MKVLPNLIFIETVLSIVVVRQTLFAKQLVMCYSVTHHLLTRKKNDKENSWFLLI